jgi:hypothetical protein
MLILNCQNHGLIWPGREQILAQAKDEGAWQCPFCEAECLAFEVPPVIVREAHCLLCKTGFVWTARPAPRRLPETAVYSETSVGFFCNVLCAGDYKARLMKASRQRK